MLNSMLSKMRNDEAAPYGRPSHPAPRQSDLRRGTSPAGREISGPGAFAHNPAKDPAECANYPNSRASKAKQCSVGVESSSSYRYKDAQRGFHPRAHPIHKVVTPANAPNDSSFSASGPPAYSAQTRNATRSVIYTPSYNNEQQYQFQLEDWQNNGPLLIANPISPKHTPSGPTFLAGSQRCYAGDFSPCYEPSGTVRTDDYPIVASVDCHEKKTPEKETSRKLLSSSSDWSSRSRNSPSSRSRNSPSILCSDGSIEKENEDAIANDAVRAENSHPKGAMEALRTGADPRHRDQLSSKGGEEKKIDGTGNQKVGREGKKKLRIRFNRKKSTSSVGVSKMSAVDYAATGDVASCADSNPARKSKTKLKQNVSAAGSKSSTGGTNAKKATGGVDTKKHLAVSCVAKLPSLPTSANRSSPVSIGGKSGKGAGKGAGKKRPASSVPEEKESKRVSIKGPPRAASKSVFSSSGKSSQKSKLGKKMAKSSALVESHAILPARGKLFAEKMGGGVAKRPSLPTSANRASLVSIGGKSGKGAGKVAGKKRLASCVPEEKESKRVSIKGPSRAGSKSVSSSSGKSSQNSKLGKKMAMSSAPKIGPPISSGPIMMQVAIASIKESYPGRRQNKDLEGWEADCMKFMRQLMKHPWVSAGQQKYIFNVPVHILFPEIRECYAAKIEHPMDLTTAEAKLLQGAYPNAETFISDIALVFSNAIAFNKDGRDVSEAMSCAYYEASTHLLKYTRWLSLEVFKSYLTDCSDSPVVESGSALDWKLTVRNREMARKEMEFIVFNELLDKTEPGDKFSWSEQECEKLLKSLRHTSDYKHMGYFVQMNFPPDYTAFISRPIAWDKCQQKLRQRKYNTIGETVADLRLIFCNALKYNEGARHTSKVSGMAYDSAIRMSGKLEAAINKMLLSVADRVGRERIDMITSRREKKAEERVEEKQRKSQSEKENPGSTVEVETKLRIIHQRKSRHKKIMTDFEFPFYDEEDERVESHADSLELVKSLYKKQREAHANVQEIALSVGISVFRRHQESAAAKAWVDRMARKACEECIRAEKEKAAAQKEEKAEEGSAKLMGTCIQSALNDSDRKQIKMSIHKPKKMKRKLLCL